MGDGNCLKMTICLRIILSVISVCERWAQTQQMLLFYFTLHFEITDISVFTFI